MVIDSIANIEQSECDHEYQTGGPKYKENIIVGEMDERR